MATTGAEDYYTQEHQISVAKYNPYQAIKLYSRINLVTTGGGTGYFDVAGDVRDSIKPFIGATVVSAEQTPGVTGLEHIKVISVNLPPQGDTRISVSPDFVTPLVPDTYVSLILSTMTNKTGDDTWPGDPDFLEDKFVRFSYRFKFDDNEYSLMAPFTQIAYIPKQDGFFLNGDEDAAYQSTIVPFMENQVQNIGLVIPLPTNANRVVADYKIKEVEILFRESDGVAVKVLESISIGSIVGASGNNNYYTYDYQSRKPYKTLPEAQTTRVYDKVPVRAFSQESSGNRIIYGNYRDQHTPPANINYNCRISKKSTTGKYNNWVEYPNHSVKRNRNYQVGFILADKFGRQSPVILSSVDSGATSNGQFYFGSTIYSPYDISPSDTNVKNWFGDAIMVLVNSEIASVKNLSTGTPGLYAIKQDAGSGNGEGYAVALAGNSIIGNTYNFRLNVVPPNNNNNNIPRVGDYLRGAYQDFVEVLTLTEINPAQNQWQVTTDGQVSDVYLRTDNLPPNTPDLKFAYTINDLGWYSYKIVVKQTQQEYYNVYLPGILNGYPGQSGAINEPTQPDIAGGIDNGLFPTTETNRTAFTVLFNDNINKIPRDLSEVGPDEKQYRSSVTLFGRVTNIMTVASGGDPSIPYNSQYYARINSEGKTAISHTSTAIARAKEVNMGYSDLSNGYSMAPPAAINTGPGIGNKAFYQIDTNPLISRISTVDKPIGATSLNIAANGSLNLPAGAENMEPYLAVYETEPVESLLDIYWETASEGLIVDLNADVLTGAGGATSFIGVTWDFDETTPQNTFVTDYFEPVNASGEVFGTPVARAELISQTNSEGEVGLFELFSGAGNFDGKFKIKYIGTNPLVFTADSRTKDVYSFLIEVETDDGDITQVPLTGQIAGFGALKNLTPSFNDIPDFSTTKDTQIILPGYPESQWTAADPKNGSGNVSQERSQLQFTISNPEDLPDNWAMNIQNGELTQAIPDGEFPGNPNGTYTVNIRVTDANGITAPTVGGDYGQLDVELNTNITIGYASVNDGAKSTTCIIDPDIETAPPSGGIKASGSGNSVTGLWYITEESTGTYLDFPTEWADITNKFRIGTENHKSGTLAITANYKQENYSVGTPVSSKFDMGKVLYYYREIDNTGNRGEWTLVPRAIEYNKSGLIGNIGIQSPFFNVPDYMLPPIVSGGDNEGFGSRKFAQTLRAFDFLQMSQNAQAIEYVFIIEDLEQLLGNNNTPVGAWVNSDDLHYPECIPWANVNIAAASFKGSNNEYQYFRSDPSSTYPNTDPINNANILYAETPYPEYVNQFFTDPNMLVPYIPDPVNIGMELNLNYATAIYPPLIDFGGNSVSNVTFSTKLSSADGVRLFNQDPNAGVNTMPTGSISNSYAGLTRLTEIV
jgi:hypothetical protein